MKEEKLEWDEEKGESFIDHNSVLVLSRGNLPHLQREFEDIIGPTAHSIIYTSGKDYASDVESNVREKIIHLWSKISTRKVAETMLEQFSRWGYGKPKIKELDTDRPYIRIEVENSANAEGYSQTEEPVCHFTRGILAGSATVLFDQDMECMEKSCEAEGNDSCIFEIIPPEEYDEKKIDRKE